MLRINVYCRDLTADRDFEVSLPNDIDKLLNPAHEYIVLDCDILRPEQFTSIIEINDIMLAANDNGIDKRTLEILSKVLLIDELKEVLENEDYYIIDFDAETASWNYGNGGNYSDEDFGLCLFKQGVSFLPFTPTEEMEDYIRWESNWTSACYCGWTDVTIHNNKYLVKA